MYYRRQHPSQYREEVYLSLQGTMECILAAAINGILFALFAGQPLNILGSTGPMLVLEMILYNFCKYVTALILF